ncbi:MAG: hypothetical protein ACDS79_10075 [Enterobacteriaceae bacterium]
MASYPGHYLTKAYGGMGSLHDLVLYRKGKGLVVSSGHKAGTLL